MKQVRFFDRKGLAFHGGILLDDGRLLCANDGTFVEAQEINHIGEYDTALGYDIIEEYPDWECLDTAITGDYLESTPNDDGSRDIYRMAEYELDALLMNITDEREGFPENSTSKRALELDEWYLKISNVMSGIAEPSKTPEFIRAI